MKNHSEALSIFQTFCDEIDNQFGMCVHTLHTNNAREKLVLLCISCLILELVTKPLVLTLHNRTRRLNVRILACLRWHVLC